MNYSLTLDLDNLYKEGKDSSIFMSLYLKLSQVAVNLTFYACRDKIVSTTKRREMKDCRQSWELQTVLGRIRQIL